MDTTVKRIKKLARRSFTMRPVSVIPDRRSKILAKIMDKEESVDKCPQCGSYDGIKIVNTNGTKEGIDIYCENCGWPDDDRREEEINEH